MPVKKAARSRDVAPAKHGDPTPGSAPTAVTGAPGVPATAAQNTAPAKKAVTRAAKKVVAKATTPEPPAARPDSLAPARPPRHERPVALALLLAEMDDAALARLLRIRCDRLHVLGTRSFERMASSLSSPDSILAALAAADQLVVGIAVAVLYLGGGPSPAALLAVLPEDLPLEVLEAALDRLEDLALVQRSADGCVHPVAAMAQVVQMPKGFGAPLRNLLGALQAGHIRFVYERVVTELGIERTLPPSASKQKVFDALAAMLADPERVMALVNAGPEGTAELASRVAHLGPSLTIRDVPPMRLDVAPQGMLDPRWWLVEHGLVLMASWGIAMMPREVAAAIRGDRPLGFVNWVAPEVRSAPVPEAQSLGEIAGHAAASLLERVGRLVADMERTPLPALKSGGVGSRTLKPLAKALGIDEREAALLIDLAEASRLVASISMLDPALDELSPAERKRRLRHYTTSEINVIVPTDHFFRWRRLSPAARWTHLVEAWLTSWRWVELAGRRDVEDKLIPAIDMTPKYGDAPDMRRAFLGGLLRLPRGQRPADPSFLERLAWERSMLWSEAPAGKVDTAAYIDETMHALGLVVSGALTPLGVVFAEHTSPDLGANSTGADQRRALIEVAAGVLPDLARGFTLQADLTAVAAGPLDPEVMSGLTALADVESRGAASVFRFTEASLRSAFDAGRTADDIVAFLEEHADRGVPQPLRYLVTDTERRHGSMRVGAAKSYVRSDDAAVMAELVKARKVAKLGLRLLAPTVAVCDQPIGKVLIAVRASGFLPAQEDANGAIVHAQSSAGAARLTAAGHVVSLTRPSGFDDDDDLLFDEFSDERMFLGLGDEDHGERQGADDDRAPVPPDAPLDEVAELAVLSAAFGDHASPGSASDIEALVAGLRAEAVERAAPSTANSRRGQHRSRVPDEAMDRLSSAFDGAEIDSGTDADADTRFARGESDEAMRDALEFLERHQEHGGTRWK